MDLPPATPVSATATPLPLRFRRPEGWPEPSVDWLAANQGWDPPAGWTPAPGVAPAPAGWVWWEPDEVGWRDMTGTVTARLRTGIAVSAAVFVAGASLTLLPATRHLGASFLFWGALIFGAINLTRNLGGLRSARESFTAFARRRAAELGQALDRSTYAEHRALRGLDALPFDAFLAQRSSEAWSFTGDWPTDQGHFGVAEQFRIPQAPAHARGRSLVTATLAAVAGVALVMIAVNALGAGQLGSGAGSAAFGNSTSSGGGTALAAGSTTASGPAPSTAAPSGAQVDALVLSPGTASGVTCAGVSNCFVVRVGTAPACVKATLVVEFFSSTSATVADRHETVTVPLSGEAYTDVAVDEPGGVDGYASVATSSCVSS